MSYSYLKRRFIQLAVAKVVIDKNRDLKVWFKLKPLMTAAGSDDFREIKSVGTYIRMYDSVHGVVVRVFA